MSADNYYLIRNHPLGGFALIDASASSDRKPRARKDHPRFDTVDEALAATRDEYYEYGGGVDPECGWVPPLQRYEQALRLITIARPEDARQIALDILASVRRNCADLGN